MESINHIKKSNIKYISLGSYCHPKMHLRKTKREISKSLPFDFHSSPNTYSIYSILDKLYENKSYTHHFKEILFIHDHNSKNEKELAVSDIEDIYFLHFFNLSDLLCQQQTETIEFPISVENNLSVLKINDVNIKFKKRYEDLYNILNKNQYFNLDILVLLRIENYINPSWKVDVHNLVNSIKQYKHPNKILIYTQIEIDEEIDFYYDFKINYDFNFPIIFHKILFDEEISSDVLQEKIFENILVNFENIIQNCIYIDFHNKIEVYYNDDNKIFVNVNNINIILYVHHINNIKIEAYYNNELYVFLKNKNNIFECIS